MGALVGADGRPLAPPAVVSAALRACIGCGCTDEHACVSEDGEPCAWYVHVGDDAGLCSACVAIAARVNGVLAQLESAGIIAPEDGT